MVSGAVLAAISLFRLADWASSSDTPTFPVPDATNLPVIADQGTVDPRAGLPDGVFATPLDGGLVTIDSARQAADAAWPLLDAAVRTRNRYQLGRISTAEAFATLTEGCFEACPSTIGDALVERAAVAITSDVYPLAFVAELDIRRLDGDPERRLVGLSRVSPDDNWRVAFDARTPLDAEPFLDVDRASPVPGPDADLTDFFVDVDAILHARPHRRTISAETFERLTPFVLDTASAVDRDASVTLDEQPAAVLPGRFDAPDGATWCGSLVVRQTVASLSDAFTQGPEPNAPLWGGSEGRFRSADAHLSVTGCVTRLGDGTLDFHGEISATVDRTDPA